MSHPENTLNSLDAPSEPPPDNTAPVQSDLFGFLLDNIPDRIYFKDTQSRFLRVSRAMVDLFAVKDASELIGKTDFDFFAPEHAEAAFRDEQEVMRLGQPMVGKEEKETLPDGRVRWAITTKMPLRDSDGCIIGTCGISRDITERKKLEEQLLRSQRLESIGTLASGVAHDLNNILAPILMSAPLIRKGLAPEMHSLLYAIERSAQRGADVVKQVLTFAKGVEGDRASLQPRYLTDEVAEIARQTFPKLIRIVQQEGRDVRHVSADATQIHQVLLNLCLNARDAMPNGGTLTIGLDNIYLDEHYAAMIPGAKPGSYVVFSIGDTGTGIPPEIVAKIFDPFFTTKDVGKGTGLGLSTVRGIVKSHDGFVNVYSEPGKGSIFKVFLPASDEQDLSAGNPSADDDSITGGGETILLVEDEVEVRRITETILKSSGYNVLTAGDGTEALAIYAQRREEIALVLTDVMMPHFDGTALTRTLKKINPEIKVVASSGNVQDARVAELRLLKPEAILVKPHTREHLLKTLHAALKSRPPGSEPERS
ncbi:MAG: ATP-binding protein [Chthoniobacteraceae bacterium]|jgi:PAS domain S-box-containing protein